MTPYGEPMKLADADTIGVASVLAEPDQYAGKYVRVSGVVDSVCESKGCWMRIGDGRMDDTLFIKFTCPVEGRLIPLEAVGHNAVVEGELKVEDQSEAEARHYAEDAGKSADEIAKIVGPQKIIRLASPAAKIEDM
jgi:hypothetical protein